MAAYADVAAFEDYVGPSWTTDDAAALTRYLERATRDIDRLLGSYGLIATGTYAGLKLDPTTLAAWESSALSDAVCAQAEYLIEAERADPLAFVTARQAGSISGPDFSITTAKAADGHARRYGPKVAGELARIAHLRIRGARARA